MLRNTLKAIATYLVLAGDGLAVGQTAEPLGSDGVETGAAEVSGAQTVEAEESRSLGPNYYGRQPIKFLSNEDAWQISLEIGADGLRKPVEPYYVQMRIPGEESDGFMLIRPFSPNSRNNMIGWMAAHCDPAQYGRVLVFRFPRDTQTQGPFQMESKFNQDPVVADINRQFNNERTRGARTP